MGVLWSKEGRGLFFCLLSQLFLLFLLGYVTLGIQAGAIGIFCGLMFFFLVSVGFHFLCFFSSSFISLTHTNFFILYSSSNFTNQTLLFNIQYDSVPVTAR